MAAKEKIRVEVAYALPNKQRLISLDVAAGTSARTIVRLAGFGHEFAGLDTDTCPLGVFGQEVAESYAPQDGDRVEIYRPLQNEPRETRRQLAARGATMGAGKMPKL